MSTTPPPLKTTRQFRSRLLTISACVAGGIIAIYSISVMTGLIKIYRIPTSAMTPTLEPGDHLMVLRFKPDSSDLTRGQLVVFDAGGMHTPDRFPLRGIWVKRIAALPGDIVSIGNGDLLVNGERVTGAAGHALAPSPIPGGSLPTYPLTIPSGRVFLLGDNFSNSLDSRYLGPIEISRISYKPASLIYPFHRAGGVR